MDWISELYLHSTTTLRLISGRLPAMRSTWGLDVPGYFARPVEIYLESCTWTVMRERTVFLLVNGPLCNKYDSIMRSRGGAIVFFVKFFTTKSFAIRPGQNVAFREGNDPVWLRQNSIHYFLTGSRCPGKNVAFTEGNPVCPASPVTQEVWTDRAYVVSISKFWEAAEL